MLPSDRSRQYTILTGRKEPEVVKGIGRNHAQSFIDVVDKMLDTLEPSLRKSCLRTLSKICGCHGLLPGSVQIPFYYDPSDTPLRHGGCANVWKGDYQGREIAVKVLNINQTNSDKVIRGFCKEVMNWKTLRHRNVLPLLGVMFSGGRFAMASEWMVNGNINQFIAAQGGANRFELLKDVVQGLMYMQNEGMIHGDLKGANVLIDQHGHACLADFGLATIIIEHTSSKPPMSSITGGTTRWMSPERLNPDHFGIKNRPTRESDCYALGMVILEVLSGDVPFTKGWSEYMVMAKVLDRERPGGPQGAENVWFTDDLWGILQACWSFQPNARPTVDAVFECLKRASTTWNPLHPGEDDDVRVPSDNDLRSGVSYPRSHSRSTPVDYREPKMVNIHHQDRFNHEAVASSLWEGFSASTLDMLLSLPNAEQIMGGLFDLDELVERLTEVLLDKSQRNEILSLTGDNAILVIDCLDKVILSERFRAKDIHTRSKVFSVISRLSRGCQYLPRTYWIDERTISLPKEPHTSGTCGEVYRGVWNGEPVAVKILRTSKLENQVKLRKRFCKEVIVWRHLPCPYVLRFNGVFYHNGAPAIVTPWMENGNINEYLEKHPEANQFRLLVCVIKGVKYLHNGNIAHGDIKGPNILISDSDPPRAVLADFGFTRVTTISARASYEEQGTAAFMAPELLLSVKYGLEKGVPSKEADVYALGMTIYQVLTGQWPFFPKREVEVMLAVLSGNRPTKPKNTKEIGMTDALWNLTEECWKEDRSMRPGISNILKRFCEIAGESIATDSADMAGS